MNGLMADRSEVKKHAEKSERNHRSLAGQEPDAETAEGDRANPIPHGHEANAVGREGNSKWPIREPVNQIIERAVGIRNSVVHHAAIEKMAENDHHPPFVVVDREVAEKTESHVGNRRNSQDDR